MEPENVQIVRGLRSHDTELLDRLIERFQFRLFRYLLVVTADYHLAEDLFQETWLRVLDRGHQYDGRWKFEAWLFSIARHLVIDHSRHKGTHTASLDSLLDPADDARPLEFAADGPSPFDVYSGHEDAERIQEALQHIPAAYREVLLLRFQEELQLDEIANILKTPLSTVKSRLYRGLETLRRQMEGEPHDAQ